MEEGGNFRGGLAICHSPFKEYKQDHDGCWISYWKNLPHRHHHKTRKIYTEDKKAYFKAHPEKLAK